MEQKYLPIGSVCTLKGKNKKIMITGYYSVQFNGNLKINDYMGCAYPEGMLLPEMSCTFNHTDIEKVDFIGFKNDEQRTFESLLNRLTGNDKDDVQRAADFHKENDMFLTSNSTYSKLLFDENGVVMIAESVNIEPKKESRKWDNIKFDKNGYVVSVENEKEIDNPFHKELANDIKKQEEPTKWENIFKNIEFDENGTVVSVDDEKELNKSTLSKIEFDENGTVISVNADSLKEEKDYGKYKFDENGTLIAVESEKIEEEIPPIGPGLPGYVEPKNKKVSNYGFDENGNIVSEETYEFDASGNLVSQNKSELEKEEEIPPIGPGLPGYVEPKKESKIEFDENGTVVSA